MNPPQCDQDRDSRRSFLLSGGGWLTSVWIASHWPAIAAAAEHADAAPEHADAAPANAERTGFEFFTAADAADVEAISGQIIPSGATPGAREARAVYFIDRALSTFFAPWANDFHAGLADLQSEFRASHPALASFAVAGPDEQIRFLEVVDRRPFFDAVRTLTLLGMFSSPKYGGNYGGAGWSMMGFKDQHAFAPPFGYYDREYTGFVAYDASAGRP